MEKVVDALTTEDANALKHLLSDSVADDTGIDEQIQALYEFIDGEIESYNIVLGPTYQSVHEGIRESDAGCDIVTTTGEYRIAIRIRLIDEGDSHNLGIQSIFAVSADDISEDIGYWGSIIWKAGITFS